jgi:hypothetical protein
MSRKAFGLVVLLVVAVVVGLIFLASLSSIGAN